MNNFIDYDYYKNNYGGTLVSSTNFTRLSLQASYFINKITFGRAEKSENYLEEIKLATCSVLEEMYKIENDGGVKVAETVGKHSVTFSNSSRDVTEEKIYYKAAITYLSNTGLLYRGI